MSIEENIRKFGIIPVVALDNSDDAIKVADALIAGGLPCAEITFRTEAAEKTIRIMVNKYPKMLIGAGTITTIEQVNKALVAGAKFIVSPGFDPEIVDYCIENKIIIIPGCLTPTDITNAKKRKLHIVKFFPAEQFGGVSTIKALAAPFKDLEFLPTGGINQKNAKEYLSCEKVIACGGSWMVKNSLIEEGKFEEIENLARGAVEIVKSCRK